LIRPLDPRPGHHRRLGVGQPRLEQEHLARLLAGGDDERRLVLERGAEVAHCVPEADAGVEVDERRPARRLGEAVGHRDDRGLLEPKDVPEVRGVVREERLLRRAEVAEDRRQAARAKQVIRYVSNRCGRALFDGAQVIDIGSHRDLPFRRLGAVQPMMGRARPLGESRSRPVDRRLPSLEHAGRPESRDGARWFRLSGLRGSSIEPIAASASRRSR
jgi:hypothetical protein